MTRRAEQISHQAAQAVRAITTRTNKPIQFTLWGFNVAKRLLWISGLLLMVSGILLFVAASKVRTTFIWGVTLAIGLLCIGGSFLSCYGATWVAFYRSMLQRVSESMESGVAVIDSAGSGDVKAIARAAVGNRGGFVGTLVRAWSGDEKKGSKHDEHKDVEMKVEPLPEGKEGEKRAVIEVPPV